MRWIVYNVLFAASCGYALRRGGPAERFTACILVAGRVLTILARSPGADRYRHFQTGIFVVDVVALAAMLGLSLNSRRWWPLWMTGLQGAAVASHGMRLAPQVNGFAYYAGIALWIYPMLVLLAVGTWRRRYYAAASTPPTSSRP